MTNEQAIEMMKAKLECMIRDVSGTDQMCNAKKCDDCDLCYEQGNMGEQKEWLRMGIKALENQKTGHWIRITNGALYEKYVCSECGRHIADDGIEGLLSIKYPYCHCGAKMKGETE